MERDGRMRIATVAILCLTTTLFAQTASSADTCRAPNCRPQVPAPKLPKPQPPKPQPPIPVPPNPTPKPCASSSYKCPDTCEQVEVLCEQPGENLCSGFCVYKTPKAPGRCALVIPHTSITYQTIVDRPNQPDALRCGQKMTPKEFNRKVESMRSLLAASLRKLRNGGAPTDPEGREMLSSIYLGLISESCTLMDEWYHMIDPYQCCHHKACAERGSAEANRQCLERSEDLVNMVTKIFPERKSKLVADYCLHAAATASAVAVEACICDKSRVVPPGVNSANCKGCAETHCSLNMKTWPSRNSICASNNILKVVKDEAQRACLKQYASGNPNNPNSHSCLVYAKSSEMPQQIYSPSSSTVRSAPGKKMGNQSRLFDPFQP